MSAYIKVNLQFTLPVEGEVDEYTVGEFRQIVFDNITNFLVCNYLEWDCDMLSEPKTPNADLIAKEHRNGLK